MDSKEQEEGIVPQGEDRGMGHTKGFRGQGRDGAAGRRCSEVSYTCVSENRAEARRSVGDGLT